jgi:ATP synthase protein I
LDLRVPEPTERDQLKHLEERIEAVKQPQAPKPHMEEHYSQAQLAWRMVIELVAGMVIGFGIGYGLDILFGTQPIFLVLFIFLGFAAGVNVMIRSAREIQAKQEADSQEDAE